MCRKCRSKKIKIDFILAQIPINRQGIPPKSFCKFYNLIIAQLSIFLSMISIFLESSH